MKEYHHNDGCTLDNMSRHHDYADKTCHNCGSVFCYTCCGRTNVHEGGKYAPDFMTCPVCDHDYYSEEA